MGAPGWLSGLNIPLLTVARVMISWFLSSSLMSGLNMDSHGRILMGFFLCLLVLCPSPPCALSLSLKNPNKLKKKKKRK